MFKTKHILEGIGPDGKGFCVSKDARGFIIKCGHQKQTAIRLPAEFSEAEINISSISERIHSHLLFKENKRKNEESEKKSQGKESRRKTSETVVIKEGQTITGDIGPKRLRQSNEIFTFCADEVGARSAINRDYGAERRKCEENKRIRVEAQAHLSSLLEERDDLISKVRECEVTFRGLLSIFFSHIGGVSTSDALPLVEMIRGAYPETEKVLEEMEDFEIEAARVNAEGSMSGTMSISAFRRGLKMSKKEYSKLRVLELKLKSTNHIELERRVEHLQTNCKKLDDDLHSRNLIVRSLKQIILKLKRKASTSIYLFCLTLNSF